MIANEGEWCLVAASGAEWSVMTGNDGFPRVSSDVRDSSRGGLGRSSLAG